MSWLDKFIYRNKDKFIISDDYSSVIDDDGQKVQLVYTRGAKPGPTNRVTTRGGSALGFTAPNRLVCGNTKRYGNPSCYIADEIDSNKPWTGARVLEMDNRIDNVKATIVPDGYRLATGVNGKITFKAIPSANIAERTVSLVEPGIIKARDICSKCSDKGFLKVVERDYYTDDVDKFNCYSGKLKQLIGADSMSILREQTELTAGGWEYMDLSPFARCPSDTNDAAKASQWIDSYCGSDLSKATSQRCTEYYRRTRTLSDGNGGFIPIYDQNLVARQDAIMVNLCSKKDAQGKFIHGIDSNSPYKGICSCIAIDPSAYGNQQVQLPWCYSGDCNNPNNPGYKTKMMKENPCPSVQDCRQIFTGTNLSSSVLSNNQLAQQCNIIFPGDSAEALQTAINTAKSTARQRYENQLAVVQGLEKLSDSRKSQYQTIQTSIEEITASLEPEEFNKKYDLKDINTKISQSSTNNIKYTSNELYAAVTQVELAKVEYSALSDKFIVQRNILLGFDATIQGLYSQIDVCRATIDNGISELKLVVTALSTEETDFVNLKSRLEKIKKSIDDIVKSQLYSTVIDPKSIDYFNTTLQEKIKKLNDSIAFYKFLATDLDKAQAAAQAQAAAKTNEERKAAEQAVIAAAAAQAAVKDREAAAAAAAQQAANQARVEQKSQIQDQMNTGIKKLQAANAEQASVIDTQKKASDNDASLSAKSNQAALAVSNASNSAIQGPNNLDMSNLTSNPKNVQGGSNGNSTTGVMVVDNTGKIPGSVGSQDGTYTKINVTPIGEPKTVVETKTNTTTETTSSTNTTPSKITTTTVVSWSLLLLFIAICIWGYFKSKSYINSQQVGQSQVGQSQFGQSQVGQSQFGQPQFGQPQFGQPQFGQPQFGQPQFGQPQFGQP